MMTPDKGQSAYEMARSGLERGSGFWVTPAEGAQQIYQNMRRQNPNDPNVCAETISPEVMQAILAQLRGAGVYR